MCLALADESYRIETAGSAEAAVRKLSCFRPDLILVDAQVPAADGARLARRLLADEELTPVPIVALTEMGAGAHSHPGAGGRFDGNIGKPIQALTLPGQVRAFLESSPQTPLDHPAGLPLPATPAADGRREATELLDAIAAGLPDSQFAPGTRTELHRLAEVVTRLQHDELAGYLQQADRLSIAATARARSRFQSVIRLGRELLHRDPGAAPGLADLRVGYLDRRCDELSGLEEALKKGDFAALRKAGHNLKGTGAAYGFAELTEIGRALEVAAKDGNAAAAEVLLDQMVSYIGILRPPPQYRGGSSAGI